MSDKNAEVMTQQELLQYVRKRQELDSDRYGSIDTNQPRERIVKELGKVEGTARFVPLTKLEFLAMAVIAVLIFVSSWVCKKADTTTEGPAATPQIEQPQWETGRQ